jgi:hypothetical protein
LRQTLRVALMQIRDEAFTQFAPQNPGTRPVRGGRVDAWMRTTIVVAASESAS